LTGAPALRSSYLAEGSADLYSGGENPGDPTQVNDETNSLVRMQRGRVPGGLLIAALVIVALAAPARAANPASDTITPGSGPVTWQGEFFAAGTAFDD